MAATERSLAPQDDDLRARWTAYRAAHPRTRIRNAAAELGVSEGALVATGCGDTATRLDGDWERLIRALPALGTVKVITRNDLAVHEKLGRFGHISIGPGHGMVVNRDIDLRLFMSHWHHGFAVTEAGSRSVRRSLQFFDGAGVSVHKVYLVEDSDEAEYESLVARHRASDQGWRFEALSQPPESPAPADESIDREILRAHWMKLRDTHDFVDLLRSFGVRREQAFRLAGEDLARPVPVAVFRQALEAAAASELPIMIFVGNPGCIQIHTGPVHRVVPTAEWLNVMDPSFELHVREPEIARAWIVRKPTRDGIVTSLELFDDEGRNVLMMFGERKPNKAELDGWRSLVAGLEAPLVAQ
jgi:putative hemin transport protein